MLMETLECCELLNYFCQVQYLLSELGSKYLLYAVHFNSLFPIIIKLL